MAGKQAKASAKTHMCQLTPYRTSKKPHIQGVTCQPFAQSLRKLCRQEKILAPMICQDETNKLKPSHSGHDSLWRDLHVQLKSCHCVLTTRCIVASIRPQVARSSVKPGSTPTQPAGMCTAFHSPSLYTCITLHNPLAHRGIALIDELGDSALHQSIPWDCCDKSKGNIRGKALETKRSKSSMHINQDIQTTMLADDRP